MLPWCCEIDTVVLDFGYRLILIVLLGFGEIVLLGFGYRLIFNSVVGYRVQTDMRNSVVGYRVQTGSQK